MRKADELDKLDVDNIRLNANGDLIQPEESFNKWLSTQPLSSQKIGNIILRAINDSLPSKSHYEIANYATRADQMNQEYNRGR